MGTTHARGPFSVQTIRGEPFQVGDRQFVPIARRASVQLLRRGTGVTAVWMRPTAVEVYEGETTRRIRIVDVGAEVWLGLLLLSILARLVSGMTRPRR